MRSSNPVLSRPDAFTPQQLPAQGGFQQPYGYQQPGQQFPQQGYQQPGQYAPQQPVQIGGVMTIDDVITKSAITLGTGYRNLEFARQVGKLGVN